MKSLRSFVPILLLSLAPAAARAQATVKPGPEIGFQSGLAFIRADNGDDWTSILGLPGNSLWGVGGVYATMFAAPMLAIEPQFSLVRTGYRGESAGQLQASLQVMPFLSDPNAAAPYAALQLGFASSFGDNSDTGYVAGGGFGYRMPVRSSLGVRFEARYRKWFGNEGWDRDEVALIVGLGALLK